MEQIRHQRTMKYKGNLNTKLPFLQNDKNALTTFLHSADEIWAYLSGSKWSEKQDQKTWSEIGSNISVKWYWNGSK